MTETYKTLGQLVTTSTETGVVYTVPAGKYASLSAMHIVNADTTSNAYTVSIVPAAEASLVSQTQENLWPSYSIGDTGPAGGMILATPTSTIPFINPTMHDTLGLYWEAMFDLIPTYTPSGAGIPPFQTYRGYWSDQTFPNIPNILYPQYGSLVTNTGYGAINTAALVAAYGPSVQIAYWCDSLSVTTANGTFNDFFLPSSSELRLGLGSALPLVNAKLNSVLGFDAGTFATSSETSNEVLINTWSYGSGPVDDLYSKYPDGMSGLLVLAMRNFDPVQSVSQVYVPSSKHAIIKNKQLASGAHHELTGSIQLSAGDKILVSSTSANVVFNLFGVELS